MIYLLIAHITIGALLVLSVIVRFMAVVLGKINFRTGRYYVVGLGAALVASGTALVIVAHSPLTGACLSALAIVIAVLAYEFGLEYLMNKRSAKEEVFVDKNDK